MSAEARQTDIPTKVFKIMLKNSILAFVGTCLWDQDRDDWGAVRNRADCNVAIDH